MGSEKLCCTMEERWVVDDWGEKRGERELHMKLYYERG
jgi:hypothetical protein